VPRFEALENRWLLAAAALGSEYQVNTTVAGDQRLVAIGSNPHANQIVMAWASANEDGSGDGIYAQRYNLYGTAIGTPFRVNTTTSGAQTAPAIAMDSLGDFVIVWQSASQDGSGDGIYGRRYGYDATALAAEFRVNSTTSGNQQAPAIAMNDTGAFAVAFQSASRDASGNAVVARVFNASGTALANDFQVNQFTSGNQQAPTIAMAASGQFIVSWQSAAQDGNGDTIVARRYGSTGTALANEFVVNQTTTGNQSAPSIAANTDGSFIIAWQSAGQDGNSDAVVARRYSAAGAALAGEFLVNQFTTGSQSAPSITAAVSGFVIAWQSAGQDGNGDAVIARQYASDGTVQGNEFVVNTFTTGAQNNPYIAMQDDGDFVVAWQSAGQETGGSTSLGVYARRYSAANDAPVMRQISNVITDVGGTITFTAVADDQDQAIDALTYSLAPGAPTGATINPASGAFTWSTATDVAPGRYFVTVQVQDLAGLIDQKTVAMTVFAPGERTVLDDYVNTLDGNYKWDIRGRTIGDGYIKYDVLLTSGMWRTIADVNKPLWQHWLEIYVPNEITQTKALLFIDGGSISSTPPTDGSIDSYAGPAAAATGTVFIDLLGVPNEPLQFTGESFTRTEDSIIAHSWNRYLATGDPTWIANLPMTRSAVRAMDAVMDFLGSPVGGNFNLDSFIVTGGSKRGWTTWLSAAVDPRVSEIVPIVSDLLNMQTSFVHHYAYYNGTFSAAVQDYVNEGVLNVNNFGTDGIDSLLSIADPYTYLNRLTLPKYIVNVANDEFFVPDSWQFYYDQLPGPKSIRYLANSSHGISDQNYYQDIVLSYINLINGAVLPDYSFHQLADGTIELTTNETIVDAKLWKATNTTARDFRWPVVGAAYTSTTLTDQGGGVLRGNVPTPPQGWTAYFIEVTLEDENAVQFKVTSGIYLKGPPTNLQPTLTPYDDVVVNEGSPLVIPKHGGDADASQTLTYSLDPSTPPQITINSTTGVINGLWNDQVASAISVIVSVWDNGTPNLPNRDTFRVTVVNVAPTASLNGSSTGTPGQSQNFTLLATDPSSVDQAAGFTFKIDWDGDGNIDQTVSGASGMVVPHTFAAGGTYNVRVTATDKDGGTSTVSTFVVNQNSAPIDPQNQSPIALTQGDALNLSAPGWTDADNDPLTYAWDLDGDGQFDDATGSTASLSWNGLVSLGLGVPYAGQIRLRVDDGHGGVTISAPIPFSIANAAPTSDAGGPYTIDEGSNLSLQGVGTDAGGAADPLTYSWDLNGDLVFGDATGANPTVTWAQLAALGITNGPASYDVRLRVSDSHGATTESTVVALTVNNVNPTVGMTGPSTALRGETMTYTLAAADAASEDQSAGFTYTIDWGDGTPAAQVTGLTGAAALHAFNVAGTLTITVTAADKDGGTSAPFTTSVHVDAVQLRPNAQNSALMDLVWGGTAGNDQVIFEQGQGSAASTTIRVREVALNGGAVTNSQDFSGVTGRVIAYGNPGNDVLDARGLLTTRATLNGNADNNTLFGGQAGDILIGGSNGGEGKQGNNVIIAGNGDNTIYGNDVTGAEGASGGNNLIVGGAGSDTIYGSFATIHKKDGTPSTGGEGGQNLIVGGGGSDVIYASQAADGAEGGHGSILIGGTTTLGQAALQAVLTEWTSSDTLALKVARIEGTQSGGANGTNYLQPGSTVVDDGSVDQIFGDTQGKPSWLFYQAEQQADQDDISRTKDGDTLTDL